ncbi:MAG: hypothetical protein J1E95_04220 [Muribaculaceae bacterium]|nr:hypothetical protein [Muribaculaceae bacterium]
MNQRKYYKIPKEWAERLGLLNQAPRHPDGWYLVLPTFAMPLFNMVDPKVYGESESLDQLITSIGGVIYNEEQAFASYRGVKEYMMDSEEQKVADMPDQPEASSESDSRKEEAVETEQPAVAEVPEDSQTKESSSRSRLKK